MDDAGFWLKIIAVPYPWPRWFYFKKQKLFFNFLILLLFKLVWKRLHDFSCKGRFKIINTRCKLFISYQQIWKRNVCVRFFFFIFAFMVERKQIISFEDLSRKLWNCVGRHEKWRAVIVSSSVTLTLQSLVALTFWALLWNGLKTDQDHISRKKLSSKVVSF